MIFANVKFITNEKVFQYIQADCSVYDTLYLFGNIKTGLKCCIDLI